MTVRKLLLRETQGSMNEGKVKFENGASDLVQILHRKRILEIWRNSLE